MLSLHQLLHSIHVPPVCLNCPQRVGSEGIWFTGMSLHSEALLCLICPAEQIFKATGTTWAPSPLSNLLLPNCSDLLVSQPRQGDAVAHQRDKAGNPYTCWSNCKSVETSTASFFFFFKRNVWCKMDLLPPHNLSQHLMRAWGRGQCQQRQK